MELGELTAGHSDSRAEDVNNSFGTDKSLNDDFVSNEFVNSAAVHNEIVDNIKDNSLNDKFINKIVSVDGKTLRDSINTENTVNIGSLGNNILNSSEVDIVMDDSSVSQ